MSTLSRFCHEYFHELSLFYFVFGACVGSFLNVCIWRIPQGQSVIVPGSYCPSCKSKIQIFENIPILSWLLLRGKCRTCRSPIPARYILVEITTAWIFLLLWYRVFIHTWPLPVLVPLSFVIGSSIAIAVIDYKYLIIPNKIIAVGLILAVIWGVAFPVTHQYDQINWFFDQQKLNILVPSCITTFGFYHIFNSPTAFAVVDISIGLLLGSGFLLLFRKFGKFIWGKKKTIKKDAVKLTISKKGLQIQQKRDAKWSDFLIGKNDILKIYGKVIQVTAESGHPPLDAVTYESNTDIEIIVKKARVSLGNESFPLDTFTVDIRSGYWVVYQEVMGMGDIKLVAMLGAFLGPSAVLFIIAASSLVATFFGVIQGVIFWTVFSRHWPKRIPFGPFIAVATIGYIFTGTEVIQYLFPP